MRQKVCALPCELVPRRTRNRENAAVKSLICPLMALRGQPTEGDKGALDAN